MNNILFGCFSEGGIRPVAVAVPDTGGGGDTYWDLSHWGCTPRKTGCAGRSSTLEDALGVPGGEIRNGGVARVPRGLHMPEQSGDVVDVPACIGSVGLLGPMPS